MYTAEEFEKRITDKATSGVVSRRIENGRIISQPPLGKKKLDKHMGPICVALALTSGQKVAADAFGINQSNVSARVNGKTAPIIAKNVAKDIKDKAADLIVRVLDGVASKDLEDLTPQQQIGIGTGLASIIEKISKKDEGGTKVQVNIYAPAEKSVDSYPMVEINSGDDGL